MLEALGHVPWMLESGGRQKEIVPVEQTVVLRSSEGATGREIESMGTTMVGILNTPERHQLIYVYRADL